MKTGLKIIITAAAFSLILVGVVSAGPNAFELPWWTVDGGGGTTLTIGNFTLDGTIGQTDASHSLITSDGQYSLTGGFWSESGSPPSQGSPADGLYLPVVLR